MTNRLNKITKEEDIETFSGGPAWEFECNTKDPKEAIDNVIKIVNILIEAKLLSRCIGFHHEKMMFDLDEESVAKFIRKNIVEGSFSESIYGDTTVYLPVDSYPGPKKSVNMSSIIRLHVSYIDGRQNIMIFTTSIIWLPFNYKGLPQIDVYALNLNRLSSALVKIEALGLEFTNDLHNCNERCIESGYLLENYAVNDKSLKYNELEHYMEDNDDIYGVYRADW